MVTGTSLAPSRSKVTRLNGVMAPRTAVPALAWSIAASKACSFSREYRSSLSTASSSWPLSLLRP